MLDVPDSGFGPKPLGPDESNQSYRPSSTRRELLLSARKTLASAFSCFAFSLRCLLYTPSVCLVFGCRLFTNCHSVMDQDSLIWRLASSGYHGLVRTATPIANQCAARVRETIRSAVYGDEDDQGAQDGASVANRASSINSVVFAYESYIFSLQRILLWDRPYHSAAALIGFNCVYW